MHAFATDEDAEEERHRWHQEGSRGSAAGAEPAGGGRHQHVSDGGAEGAQRQEREEGRQGPVRVQEVVHAEGCGQDHRDHLRAPDDGNGTVLHLERPRDVERESVRYEGDEDHPHTQCAAGAFADGGQGDEGHPRDPDREPPHHPRGRELPGNDRGDDDGKEGGPSVEHPGERRTHMLFGVREHREREGEPEDAQRPDREPLRPGDLLPRLRKAGEGDKADGDPGEGDPVRPHRLEPLGDEEERRAPDEAGDEDVEPVSRGGRFGHVEK